MKQINFKYKFDKNYNPIYINGAYGGIGPRGEIIANFYFERHPLPNCEKYDINEDGNRLEHSSTEPEGHEDNIIRFVETGVIMNIDSAKRVYEWLGKHIENLESKLNGNDG